MHIKLQVSDKSFSSMGLIGLLNNIYIYINVYVLETKPKAPELQEPESTGSSHHLNTMH